jgi:hypothetical protein
MADFFGNGFDDPRSGQILGLAQGLLSAPGGQGLAAGLGYMNQARESDMKSKLSKAQLDSLLEDQALKKQKVALMQRQQAMQENLLGVGGGSQPSAGPSWGTGDTSTDQITGLAPKVQTGGLSAPSGGGLAAISQRYGVPMEALQFDMAMNGGKKIAELVAKAAEPDWKVNNNYAFNTKDLKGPTFLPGMNTSNDGQSSLTLIDPATKLPVVAAPRGALDTFSAYQEAKNASNAAYTPGRPFIGSDSRMYPQSQLDEVRGGSRQSASVPSIALPPRGANAGEREMRQQVQDVKFDPKAEIAAITRELPSLNPRDRAIALDQLQRLHGATSSPAGALDFSPTEKAQQEALATRLKGAASADVARETGTRADSKRGSEMVSNVDRAIELLKEGPTASLAGQGVDKVAGWVGIGTQGAKTAAQLQTLSGYMTANTPRMEGPQSNADLENYKTMAGRVGDSSLAINIRMAAAEEVKRLTMKYADLNNLTIKQSGAQASGALPPSRGQVVQGYKFNGGDPADKSNWEKQ